MEDFDALEEIRSLIRSGSQPLCGDGEEESLLRRVVTVGGQYRRGQFNNNDMSAVLCILEYLCESGLPIAADFTVENYNLDPEYDGRDFLDPENVTPADLILFLMVFDPPEEEISFYSRRSRNHMCCVSPAHSHGAFREAVARSGAKVLGFWASGSGEINESIVCEAQTGSISGAWSSLLGTQERANSHARDPFNRGASLPCSVAVRQDYLDVLRKVAMAPQAEGAYRTLLHQRVAEYNPC